MHTSRLPAVLITASLALTMAACGGDDDDAAAPESTDPPADDADDADDAEDSADDADDSDGTDNDGSEAADSAAGGASDGSVDAEADADDAADADPACAALEETADVIVTASSANMAFAPVFLAAETGAFEAEGLDVTIETLSASDAIPPLGQGRVDVVLSTLSAGTLNAIDSGVELKWAAPLYLSNPESREGLYVQAEYADDAESFDITSIEGGAIASPAGLGGTSSYIIARELIDAGLTFDDIGYNQMGAPDILIALEQGSVEMGWMSTPFWTETMDSDDLVWLGGFDPDQNGTAMLVGPKLSDRPDVGAAFFRAVGKTIRDYMSDDDYLDDPNTAAALATALGLEIEDLETPAPNLFDPMQELTGADEFAQGMQEAFIEVGGLLEYDSPMPSDAIIDDSMVAAARPCI